MARKKKEEIDLNELDFKALLEEAIGCGRVGRTIASYGATLTGREKHDARLIYLLLKAGKEIPRRTPAIADVSIEKKSKKYSPTQAIKWFAEKYPKEAEPLLRRLEESYNKTEKAVVYGLKEGEDLSDDYYIGVLVNILQIPRQDAAVMYHGVIKPQFEREEAEKGLIKLVMEK